MVNKIKLLRDNPEFYQSRKRSIVIETVALFITTYVVLVIFTAIF